MPDDQQPERRQAQQQRHHLQHQIPCQEKRQQPQLQPHRHQILSHEQRHGQQKNQQQQPRASRARVKVRSGCITCKIRKIKCDEGKPMCHRCTSTGRKCDGYQAIVASRFSRSSLTRGPPVVHVERIATDAHLLSHQVAGLERQWIAYFSRRAGPALSQLIDVTFWSALLPQLCVQESAVRHAMLAASYSIACIDRQSGLAEPFVDQDPGFGLRQYGLAMNKLQQRLRDRPAEADVPLLCCLLFVCLECALGKRTAMLHHLRSGIKILKATGNRLPSPSRTEHVVPNMPSLVITTVRQLFARIDAQSTLFGEPVSSAIENQILALSATPLTPFRSGLVAEQSLDSLMSLSLKFVKMTYSAEWLAAMQLREYSVYALQIRLQDHFFKWMTALHQFESATDLSHDCRDSVGLMRIQATAGFIYLCNCLETQESAYDVFESEFATIVRTAQALLETGDTESPPQRLDSPTSSHNKPPQSTVMSAFTLDAHVIPALYLTATSCRHPVIRREALRLLKRNPSRQCLWDARLHGQVAGRVIEIEEELPLGSLETFDFESPPAHHQALAHANATSMHLDEGARIRVEIEWVSEGPERFAGVTFERTTTGVSGIASTWQEQVWY